MGSYVTSATGSELPPTRRVVKVESVIEVTYDDGTREQFSSTGAAVVADVERDLTRIGDNFRKCLADSAARSAKLLDVSAAANLTREAAKHLRDAVAAVERLDHAPWSAVTDQLLSLVRRVEGMNRDAPRAEHARALEQVGHAEAPHHVTASVTPRVALDAVKEKAPPWDYFTATYPLLEEAAASIEIVMARHRLTCTSIAAIVNAHPNLAHSKQLHPTSVSMLGQRWVGFDATRQRWAPRITSESRLRAIVESLAPIVEAHKSPRRAATSHRANGGEDDFS